MTFEGEEQKYSTQLDYEPVHYACSERTVYTIGRSKPEITKIEEGIKTHIPLNYLPCSITHHKDDVLYTTHFYDNSISKIEKNKVTELIPTEEQPCAAVFCQDALYVYQNNERSLSIIHPTKQIQKVKLGILGHTFKLFALEDGTVCAYNNTTNYKMFFINQGEEPREFKVPYRIAAIKSFKDMIMVGFENRPYLDYILKDKRSRYQTLHSDFVNFEVFENKLYVLAKRHLSLFSYGDRTPIWTIDIMLSAPRPYSSSCLAVAGNTVYAGCERELLIIENQLIKKRIPLNDRLEKLIIFKKDYSHLKNYEKQLEVALKTPRLKDISITFK